MKTIVIAGAGLTGAMLGILLARRGYRVAIFEKRPDPRRQPVDFGRSINLSMMARGLRAMERVGLAEVVRRHAVPVRGRAIHTPDGRIVTQPLGRNADEHVWVISRTRLNSELLDAAERTPNVEIHFRSEVREIDFSTNKVTILESHENRERTVQPDVLLGADGASSVVREKMVAAGKATFEREVIGHAYKELRLASRFTADYAPEHFHSWPRQSFMIFGNPNTDGSLTLTLFLKTEGMPSFSTLTERGAIGEFFRGNFPDLRAALPDLVSDFVANPMGKLGMIKGGPWFHENRVLLVGDAAHAIVPFFGQGMNCSFEDCMVLDGLLDTHTDDWTQAIPAFYEARRPNTDAVAELAMYNYGEIQSRVNDPAFRLRREVEFEIMKRYPGQYVSMHVMVMFHDVPYGFARSCLSLQNGLLEKLCSGIRETADVNWNVADGLVREYCGSIEQLGRTHSDSLSAEAAGKSRSIRLREGAAS